MDILYSTFNYSLFSWKMTISILFLNLKLEYDFLSLCVTENENLLALLEGENPDASLVWSVISASQVKNEEKVMKMILLWSLSR